MTNTAAAGSSAGQQTPLPLKPKVTSLSKTDYILYRECPKNVWYKLHKPDLYAQGVLSDFEKSLMETGSEVELVARNLFPGGILIEEKDEAGQKATKNYIAQRTETLFQPVFLKDRYLARIDVLRFEPENGSYSIYEVKSTNDVDKKSHYHDVSFQVCLLRECGLKVEKAYVIHLNAEYVRSGELDIMQLFKVIDISNEVNSLCQSVATEMAEALAYLENELEPEGPCCCIYKGRSGHCSTFQYANPEVPEYGVHDIARIGNSKAKLKELVDNKIFHLDRIPAHIKLSEIQQSQVDTYKQNKVVVKTSQIVEEFGSLTFPICFLDYETFPAAIPRFDGFSPHQHIPFQYSVDVLESPESELRHYEFIYVRPDDPSQLFAESLEKHVGTKGSIVVWHKVFECNRNSEIAIRIPVTKGFCDAVNARVYDLEEIFKKQYYIHREFRGSTSIKRIMPVLVPELSYKELGIQDGTAAAYAWNQVVSGSLSETETQKALANLRAYCALDTHAMYSIWCVVHKICKQ